MIRLGLLCSFLLGLPSIAQVGPDHGEKMARSQALFTKIVRPVFEAHCLECHGGKKIKSGFSLLSREDVLKGGDLGLAVVPGKPEASPLLDYIGHVEEPFMPPKKPPLQASDREAVAAWIQLGAAYDKPFKGAAKQSGPMVVTDEDRAYWAFRPLAKADGSIDDHIEAAWDQRGLVPAPEADRRTLIRRASFDLLGLPPSPPEIHAFLKDERPGAFARVIDRLLDSPQYGERWARHWMDVARFAESHGFEHDYDRPYAYHYRDFLIRAFNEDMAYDQFVKWQMAGDEFAPEDPQALLATGFLGAGVYPTQITVNEAERIRYDAMDDMLATAGQAVLGLTIGCARCHDHKYDPIPTRDYYRMLSSFTTTVRTEIDLSLDAGPELVARQAAVDRDIAVAQKDLDQYVARDLPKAFATWREGRAPGQAGKRPTWSLADVRSITARNGTTFTPLKDGSYRAAGKNPDHEVYTVTLRSDAMTTAVKLEALADDGLVRRGPGRAGNGNFGLTEIKASIRDEAVWKPVPLHSPTSTFDQNGLGVAKAIDGSSAGCWAVDPQFGKDHAAVFHFGTAIKEGVEIRLELDFRCNTQHAIGRPRFSLSGNAAPVPLKQGEGLSPEATLDAAIAAGKPAADCHALFQRFDPRARELEARIAELKASRPVGRKEKVMVCTEGSHIKPMRRHTQGKDFYAPTYILHRGDEKQKQEVAEFGVLQVLNASGRTWFEAPPADAKTTWRRRALATWMMDTEAGGGNLAARVMANRVWMWHMGRGLVDTPNDFGYQGDSPSHPELLDLLATRFQTGGWRLKSLHKDIMLSRAYRLANLDHAANERADPDNAFYWKRAPQRLQAEAIRDQLLAVSGQLDTTLYGKGTLDPNSRRRSIYFMVKRSQLVPMLQVFDWPDTLTSCGKRQVTTTAPQALFFLNNPQVRTWAEAFAASLQKESEPLAVAWERATGKSMTAAEREAATAFVAESGLVEYCHALLSSNASTFVE